MPSVTARVPDSLRVSGYIGAPINASIKAKLTQILKHEDLTLHEVPLKEVAVHANFWLNQVDFQRLGVLGEPLGLSVGEVVTALLVMDARLAQQPTVPAPADNCSGPMNLALRSLGLHERAEQTLFYRAIAKVCDPDPVGAADHKVLFAEAGTGTGKTLAYLVAAHHFLTSNRSAHIAFAVPSHALMDKVLHDWGQLTSAMQTPIATVALLGQGEFVSVQALKEVLQEVDDVNLVSAIQGWIERSGPPSPGSMVHQRWSMAGLRSAAPTFTLHHNVTLEHRQSDDDPGFLSYRGQWAGLAQVNAIFLTHAMLANLTLRRIIAQAKALKDSSAIRDAIAAWAAVPRHEREERLYEILNGIYASTDDPSGQDLIPTLDLLIVDEAHLLDDAFALVLSRTVSMWALRRDIHALHGLQPRVVKRADIDVLEAIWQRLSARGDADTTLTGDDLMDVVTALSSLLGDVCARKRPRDSDPVRWRRLSALSHSLNIALQSRAATNRLVDVMVRWSPDRRWPQLTIGRISYAREMNYLWTVIARRSCIVSGTLYEEIPQLSCEAARRALNVPFDNMLTMEPVHASWQYTPVTVCMIGAICTAAGRPRFVRPRTVGESAQIACEVDAAISHEAWVQDVAGYICQAHRDGAGGMLVLGTAFRDLQAIADVLTTKLDEPVLLHKAGYPLATLREQFIERSENGARPLLLAAGGAWTGFDLYSSKQANACTDLVILNTPFGATSRTLAREARMRQKHGFPELIAQVVVLVRQGIGRLVRSPDTPANRRIHWLDAKIHQPSTAGLLNPVRRVFAKYRQMTVG